MTNSKRARDRLRIRHQGPPSSRRGETAAEFGARLADQIHRYWRGRGEATGLTVTCSQGAELGSNMRNGVPPDG